MKTKALFKRFLVWRIKHIGNRQFVLLLSAVVGLGAGLAAIVIKNSVHLIQELLHFGISENYHNYLYFAYPAVGIFLAVLFIRYVIRRPVRHGIPNVLYSISKKHGHVSRHNMFSSVATSALTVGFGGSVGLEGPTVATGAAIGSNIGRLFHLNYKETVLMLGCACAGAMSAIFKAPIAAVVFALEVIMLDLTVASIVPLLIASATAALTSYFFLGQDVLYHFDLLVGFQMTDIPYYILLGILAGFVSIYFTRTYLFFGKIFEKIRRWWVKLSIGGLALGLLIFIFPALYGEGYEAINACLQGDYSYLFEKSLFYPYREKIGVVLVLLLLVVLFKVVATSVTFGSGGVGGIFAPTLFMGANMGLLFSLIINKFNLHELSERNFALVGMAGLIAGVLHAPLTAIFLIADITKGYDLFMPLMLTATFSYATIKLFESNSVYTIQLAKRGELMTHHKDKNVLKMMKVKDLLETDFQKICPEDTLGDLVQVVSVSKRNIFPVVDKENFLRGIVTLNDIRNQMFKPKLYNKVKVRDIMYSPMVHVNIEDSMEVIAQKIQDTGRFNIPVLDSGKYLGFVSRANVFSTYRRMLKHFSED